ncbi:hypothetical protein BN946_scf185043.g5 [Trametes cinnabarina]|uniref:Ribonuclease H1 N-terminal domain-containing protein n=1 Tax=Pycnoporus cinnabarinus TaxID=5643 RepID=A0A060SHG9_PYCCI|nr:hypothetical protein BN946_scf185043.g5 [Trametes cinnabarina]
MVSTSLLRDFDQTARSLGITPKTNEDGELIPVGLPEEKEHVYVVWVGRGIGLFYNWGLTLAMTCGFPGAAHKKYHSLESARQGWVQGPTRMWGTWQIPIPRVAIPTPGLPPEPAAPSASAIPHYSSLPASATLHDPLPKEVQLTAAADSKITVDLRGADALDSDNEYWSEVDDLYNDQPDRPDQHTPPPSTPSPPDSPTLLQHQLPIPHSPAASSAPSISSVSSFPLSSMLSDGTVSPDAVYSPLPASPASSVSAIRSELGFGARRPPASSTSASPLRLASSTTAIPLRLASSISASPLRQAIGKAGRGASGDVTKAADRSSASELKPRTFYVVVRGEYPGVYFSRDVALEKLGTRPGIKIVRFHSLSHASWYFTQEYMAHRVGVPVLVSPTEE